jgi:hypothetical protein
MPEDFALRAPVPRETEIIAAVTDCLRVCGILVARINVMGLTVDKGAGGGAFYRSAPRGWPDLTCLVPPRLARSQYAVPLFLEVKRPGVPVPPHQARMHALLRQAGALVAVVHSADETREFLRAAGLQVP